MGKEYFASAKSGKKYLVHYGIKRRSGRYPWGSGEDPYQHEGWYDMLLDDIKAKKAKGMSELQIADSYGVPLQDLRRQQSLAVFYKKEALRLAIMDMNAAGMNTSEIARKLGKNESSVRTIIKNGQTKKQKELEATINALEERLTEVKYLDIGAGTASSMGVVDARFETAVQDLWNKGFEIADIYIEQANNPDQGTTVHLLVPKGTSVKEIYSNLDQIGTMDKRFADPHGTTLYGLKPPENFDSKRLEVRYAEEGGTDRDGTIELRRGAEGLDLGNANYAQVRIAVDGTHYLKGMAYYVDDLPDGIDIRFNTNKSNKTPKLDTLKKLKDDPDNPFGAQIKNQSGYLNIVNEEGDWGGWSKSLASQMLSKQSLKLAKNQLDVSYYDHMRDFEEIKSYKNPVVRQYLLQQFADSCDTAAVDLKAAAMPKQASYVLLPLPGLKENEIYAPNFKQNDRVVMIRYPHGGTFEIPEVTVNNNVAAGKKIIGPNSVDAIGIHPKVAAQLSGADFDGDTVIAFPDNRRQVKSSKMLVGLRDFDPKADFPATKLTRRVNADGDTIQESVKQREMGVVSNLICDMTIKHNDKISKLQDKMRSTKSDAEKAKIKTSIERQQAAFDQDITRAVKYSMVVIDSLKHQLDYKAADKILNIAELKKKYQAHEEDDSYGGASTLISKAGAVQRVTERRLDYRPDPDTGRIEYVETGRTRVAKDGSVVPRTSKIEAMRLTHDPEELSSGTRMEAIYSNYARSMKQLGDSARKEAVHTTLLSTSPQSKKKYATEISEIDEMLNKAKAHAPIERKAQIIAKSVLDDKRQKAGAGVLTKAEQARIRSQALAKARASLGGSRPKVHLTDKQWEAVDKGAISKSKITQLLRFMPAEEVREHALPKKRAAVSQSQVNLMIAWKASGYTNGEIADMLGLSPTTVGDYIRGTKKAE